MILDNLRTIYHGDSRDMKEIPDESIQCVVTSPPYWGLRKYAGCPDLIWGGKDDCRHEWGDLVRGKEYGRHDTNDPSSTNFGAWANWDGDTGNNAGHYCLKCGAWRGQFGLEPTIELYVAHTLVFLKEIWRVLRKDGVVFWNVGDSYMSHAGDRNKVGGFQANPNKERLEAESSMSMIKRTTDALKDKDLCLIPYRVALAAQQQGWWVRSAIIWNKPNPMPESVTDRPTNAYEHIFLFTKSARYYWDMEAVREPHIRLWEPETNNPGWLNGSAKYVAAGISGGSGFKNDPNPSGRNLRDVWTFPTKGYSGAHFAVFPPEIPERCIKAGTPEYGCCDKCGSPYERIIKKENNTRTMGDPKLYKSNPVPGDDRELGGGACGENLTQTLGWQQTCKCKNSNPVPSTVLDPFSGSGTTLLVAAKLGIKAIGYELSDKYQDLIVDRNRQMAL